MKQYLCESCEFKNKRIVELEKTLTALLEALKTQTTKGKPSRYCANVMFRMNDAKAAMKEVQDADR